MFKNCSLIIQIQPIQLSKKNYDNLQQHDTHRSGYQNVSSSGPVQCNLQWLGPSHIDLNFGFHPLHYNLLCNGKLRTQSFNNKQVLIAINVNVSSLISNVLGHQLQLICKQTIGTAHKHIHTNAKCYKFSKLLLINSAAKSQPLFINEQSLKEVFGHSQFASIVIDNIKVLVTVPETLNTVDDPVYLKEKYQYKLYSIKTSNHLDKVFIQHIFIGLPAVIIIDNGFTDPEQFHIYIRVNSLPHNIKDVTFAISLLELYQCKKISFSHSISSFNDKLLFKHRREPLIQKAKRIQDDSLNISIDCEPVEEADDIVSISDPMIVQPIVKDKPTRWKCGNCNILQDISHLKCFSCNMPRQQCEEKRISAFDKLKKSTDYDWKCSACNKFNNMHHQKCCHCSIGFKPLAYKTCIKNDKKEFVPYMDPHLYSISWTCHKCTFINEDFSKTNCAMCGTADTTVIFPNNSQHQHDTKQQDLEEFCMPVYDDNNRNKFNSKEDVFSNIRAKELLIWGWTRHALYHFKALLFSFPCAWYVYLVHRFLQIWISGIYRFNIKSKFPFSKCIICPQDVKADFYFFQKVTNRLTLQIKITSGKMKSLDLAVKLKIVCSDSEFTKHYYSKRAKFDFIDEDYINDEYLYDLRWTKILHIDAIILITNIQYKVASLYPCLLTRQINSFGYSGQYEISQTYPHYNHPRPDFFIGYISKNPINSCSDTFDAFACICLTFKTKWQYIIKLLKVPPRKNGFVYQILTYKHGYKFAHPKAIICMDQPILELFDYQTNSYDETDHENCIDINIVLNIIDAC